VFSEKTRAAFNTAMAIFGLWLSLGLGQPGNNTYVKSGSYDDGTVDTSVWVIPKVVLLEEAERSTRPAAATGRVRSRRRRRNKRRWREAMHAREVEARLEEFGLSSAWER